MISVVSTLSNLIRDVGETVHQCWLADDASDVGLFEGLRLWWDKLAEIGLRFGYIDNESKNMVHSKLVKELFRGTDVKFRTASRLLCWIKGIQGQLLQEKCISMV